MLITKQLSLKLSECRTSLQSKNKTMQMQPLCNVNNEDAVLPVK